jgi:hypothetical protein
MLPAIGLSAAVEKLSSLARTEAGILDPVRVPSKALPA